METSIKASYKRKANPFDNANYVVASGWKRKGDPTVHFDYFGDLAPPANWFIKLLDGTKILVGQNIKFDILYAIRDPANRKAWMRWVADGGIVWDIQLAEYLLEGMAQHSHMLSLDELAPMYGGNVKFDEVKALWAAGIDTISINPDLLRKYLCGDETGQGDVGNTEMVFNGQLDRARAAGQVKSILMNMGSLLCTIEMEFNGMYVDKELGLELAEKLAVQLAELSVELNGHLPADLPFHFNWGSGKQKSAVLFGGDIPYKIQEPMWKSGAIGKPAEGDDPLYFQVEEQHYVLEDGSTMAVDRWHLWDDDAFAPRTRPNIATFKGGKNAGEYKTKKVKVDDVERGQKLRRVDYVYTFPRLTEPKKAWEGATPGQWSTSAEVIKELGNRDIPFLKSLSKVTSLAKDLSTYYITTDPDTGEQKGMLTLVDALGIIHHMLNHTSTVTARFSSSNPNLQNLPKGDKSDVKKLFKSRFKGGSIVQSDFTALEVYVQAILTQCRQLIEDLKAGLDMHCVRVSQKEGITYEEAVLRCKGDKAKGIAPIKEWDTKRTKAKVFSFQRAYGAGAPKISESAGIPLEEVEALIAAEAERYPEIEPWYEALTAQIEANSKTTGKFVEHPEIRGLTCQLKKSYWRTPDNKLYTWVAGPAPEWLAKMPASRGGKIVSFSPTEIKNYPVQGTGGEWAKAAMWLAIRAFYARENFGGLALLVNQVHDALYSDTDESVRVEAAALLHACMEEASTFMEWYFDWKVPVPVPSATNWGSSMYEEKPFEEPEFAAFVSQFRPALRTTYMNNYQPTFH